MATAKHVPAVVETKTVEVSPEKVVLELSLKEAEVLRTITGKLRTPTGSVEREYVENVWNALRRADIPFREDLTVQGSLTIKHDPTW